jgi:hypothetical protein
LQPRQGFGVERTEAFGKQALNDRGFAHLLALQDAALNGEAFDTGGVARPASSFQDGEQVEDALTFPTMRFAQAKQSLFHT